MRRTIPLLFALCLACSALPQGNVHGSARLKVKAIADSGTLVYLSDGSAWEVRTENRNKAAAWPKGAGI